MEQYKYILGRIKDRRQDYNSISTLYSEEIEHLRVLNNLASTTIKIEVLSNLRLELKKCVDDHSFDMNEEFDRFNSALHEADHNDLLARAYFKAFFWGIYFNEEVYTLEQLLDLYSDTVRAIWELVDDKHIFSPISFGDLFDYNLKNNIWTIVPPLFEFIRLFFVFKVTNFAFTRINNIIVLYIHNGFQHQFDNNMGDLTLGKISYFDNRLPLIGKIINESNVFRGIKSHNYASKNNPYETPTEIIGKIKANTEVDILEASSDGYYIHIGDNRFVHKNNIQLI